MSGAPKPPVRAPDPVDAGTAEAARIPVRIGRYRALRVLGEGGMGVVYAAFDDELARPVAIKLVRRLPHADAGTHARARMRREAQAMAQLSHPNVVPIYDVGEQDGELYLAMELIRGETLDAWLAELGPPSVRARRWREVVAVFVAAGRGLAAAHAAGLVHRDFKPANVLIGDGVVKVGDFGVARGGLDEDRSPPIDDAQGGASLSERMTATGAVIGTPAYLAPEQLVGRPGSAASDQFAFCVALHEGLVGQRPFAGDDLRSLAANLLAARRQIATVGVEVPAWVMAVINRGLAREPADRWPNMDALLTALLDDPRRRRRRRLALVTALLGVFGVAVGVSLSEARRQSMCAEFGAAIDEGWNAETRQRLAGVFAATDAPDAPATWDRVAPRLDAWTGGWRGARREACLDADAQPDLARRRAACLEHERWELAALLDVFATADRTTVIDAVTAVAELPEVTRCADPVWLAADGSLVAAPDEEGVRLRRDLARVLALTHAGRHAEALQLAEAAAVSAKALGDPVLEAEALGKLGGIRWRIADFPGAEKDLLTGYLLAGRVEHDLLAYATARDLSWVVGVRLARPKEGRVWLDLARMNLARSGGDPEVEADLFERLGELEFAEGRPEAARDAHQRAFTLREQRLGAEHPAIAESLLALGKIQMALGDERAPETLARARAIAVAALGPSHRTVANADNELGAALFGAGRHAESVEALRRALVVRERALGPDDPGLANILASLAAVLNSRGELLESQLLLERSVAILERALGPRHPDTLAARNSLAATLGDAGRIDEAVAMLRDTAAGAEQALGPDAPLVALTLGNLAVYLGHSGDHAGTLPLWQRVLAIDEARLGRSHPEVAADLAAVARSHLAVGDLATALASAQRSLAIREAALPPDDPDRARSLDTVALALLALGRVDEAASHHGRALAIRAAAMQAVGDPTDLSELREELARLRRRP